MNQSRYIIVIFTLLFFCIGMFFGVKKLPPYKQFRDIYSTFFINNNDNDVLLVQNNCEIENKKKISKDSIAIIGHPYSWIKDKGLLNSEVINFLIKNQKNLKLVIFSGDLFRIPSISKWENLKQFMQNLNLEFIIAPGNHDVEFGDNSLRDIFNLSFGYNFPIEIKYNETKIQIDDSTKIYGRISNDILLNLSEKNNIIIQHHSPIKEFLEIANSLQHLNLHSYTELNNEIDTKTTFIMGDFGIHYRFFCFEYDKVRFIGSGISGKGNEEILILDQNKLFRHNL
jgi:hypothetical protein